MIPFVLALTGAYGVHLAYTAVAYRWAGLSPGPRRRRGRPRREIAMRFLGAVGVDGGRPGELVLLTAVAACVAGAVAYGLFGGVLAPAAGGLAGATAPSAALRSRRTRQLAAAREAWPRIIEEIRIRTTAVGRSIPQALFEAGQRGLRNFVPRSPPPGASGS